MTIIVDSREPTRINEKLSKKKVDVKRDYLDIGDYLLNGSVCIERKTIRDFIASIKDGRLWTQLSNLQQYDHAVIALIGTSKEKWESFYKGRSKWVDKSWIGTLATITCRFNVNIIPFDDESEFINYLISIEQKLSSNKTSSRPSPLVKKPTNDQERRENCLCAIPGVSIKKAQTLLTHYGTVGKIASAGVNSLQHVDGIGKKLAKNIYQIFN